MRGESFEGRASVFGEQLAAFAPRHADPAGDRFTVHDHLARCVAFRLEQHRIHVGVRHDACGERLEVLRRTDLAKSLHARPVCRARNDARVVAHVLRTLYGATRICHAAQHPRLCAVASQLCKRHWSYPQTMSVRVVIAQLVVMLSLSQSRFRPCSGEHSSSRSSSPASTRFVVQRENRQFASTAKKRPSLTARRAATSGRVISFAASTLA